MNERSLLLYNIDRKNITAKRKALARPDLVKGEVSAVIMIRSEKVSVSGTKAINNELNLLKKQLFQQKLF